jgi:hypothetical protein
VNIYVNAKMIPFETNPGIREKEIKENGKGGKFMHDILDTL